MIELQYNNDLTYEHWVSKRKDSIGASEVSPICFGSPYTSNVEIFYQKVTGIKKDIENIRTFIGKKSENIVDQFYPYYEGTEESIYKNYNAGRLLRKIENRNVTGRNSKFPHITATPDRFVLPFGIYDGKKEALTEYKNTQSHVLKQYSPDLPLDNIIQLLTQLKVFELDYGELFYFIDNRRYDLYPMLAKNHNKTWQLILDRTIPFWENVLKARKLYNQKCEAQRKFNEKLVSELEFEIQQLEPPVQHTVGYLKYMNENYKSRAALGGKEAKVTEIEKAIKYNDIGKKIDKLKNERLAIEIDLKLSMEGATVLNLGNKGSVYWQQYENRKVFKVNIK